MAVERFEFTEIAAEFKKNGASAASAGTMEEKNPKFKFNKLTFAEGENTIKTSVVLTLLQR